MEEIEIFVGCRKRIEAFIVRKHLEHGWGRGERSVQ